MAIRHSITLSTTEPNNEIGVIKIRQADEQTQTLEVQITENGVPKSYQGLAVYFCAKLGQTAGLGIIEQKLNPEEMTDPANGKLEYTMRAEDWQILGRQRGYFSFRKMKDEHEFVEQFTTRDFTFDVIKSVYSDGLKEVKKDGSTYVWTIEDMLRLFDEYIASGKTDWEEFVEQNREILESVDPGGKLIGELIDARQPFGGDAYATLGERLDESDAQLAQKANYEDIANLTSAKPTFIDDVSGMVDEGTVYVNTTDGFVYLYNSSSSKFENTNVLYQAKGINPNGVTLDNIKDDEFILNYVTKDTSNNLPIASAEPNEVRLNERGNIYFSNGNLIDIVGMTDGTYTEDGLTVVIEGNKIKVTGTPSINKYFKLSGGSGFVPNNSGMGERDYTLPLANAYTFGLYDVINTLGGLFTVSVRSSVSGNYLQVNPTLTVPYKEGNDQSLFGVVYMFFSANSENDTEFKLFFSPSTYDISNEIAPNTNVYSNVLKARSKAKFVLSDRTGVAKPLVRMTDIVGGGGAGESVSGVYVEGFTNYFHFYIKGSDKDSNKYLRYTFEYWDGVSINNGKGWVLGVVDAVELVGGVFNVLYPVTKAGEWEMAIRLKDRPDFIGCKQHGSEVNFYEKFYIDGTQWTPDNSNFWCKEIKVVEKSTMYDPLDEVTIVGNHIKDYSITDERIKIRQLIKWTTAQTMGNNDVYTAMLPMVRGNDATTPHQITSKAYDDATYEEIDVSNASHGARTARHEPDKWTLYSDATGISASIQSKNKVKLPGANSFIQNSASYNKVYFNYCAPEYTVAVGDVWENEITYKLNINV